MCLVYHQDSKTAKVSEGFGREMWLEEKSVMVGRKHVMALFSKYSTCPR